MVRHFFLILIPGVGQVQQDRHLLALLLFFIFVFAVNGYFVGPLVVTEVAPEKVRMASLAAAAVVWILSALDYLRAAARRRATPPPVEE